MAKIPLLNSDDFINDPLFGALRAFGNAPVQGKEHQLGQLMAVFSQAKPKAGFNLTKFLGIGALAIGLGIPSLAYAGLLPHQISSNLKTFVTSVGSVVTKPVTSIVNSITSDGQGAKNPSSGGSESKSDLKTGSGDAKITSENSDGKNTKNENHSQEKSNESDHKHPSPAISLNVTIELPSISGVGDHSETDNSGEQGESH